MGEIFLIWGFCLFSKGLKLVLDFLECQESFVFDISPQGRREIPVFQMGEHLHSRGDFQVKRFIVFAVLTVFSDRNRNELVVS